VTIKAILHTNVIVSGIFWKGAPFEILKAWQKRRFLLAVSLPILNEYRRVLDEMTKKRPSPVLGSILEVIELHSEIVEPVSFTRTVCSDLDDDKFLEAALAADADYVVSGDAVLLSLKNTTGSGSSGRHSFSSYCPASLQSDLRTVEAKPLFYPVDFCPRGRFAP
jgi:putative PIN family toxin of toxin-antitoxin system